MYGAPGEIIASELVAALDAQHRGCSVALGHTSLGWLAVSTPPAEPVFLVPSAAVVLIGAIRRQIVPPRGVWPS